MHLECYLTNTTQSIPEQWETIHAATHKAADGVITVVVTPSIVSGTLINICMLNEGNSLVSNMLTFRQEQSCSQILLQIQVQGWDYIRLLVRKFSTPYCIMV